MLPNVKLVKGMQFVNYVLPYLKVIDIPLSNLGNFYHPTSLKETLYLFAMMFCFLFLPPGLGNH